MSLFEIIFGRRLASQEVSKQQINPLIGVAVLGLDAISSAVYGPEAVLTVLLPVGVKSIQFIVPVTIAVITLLLILFFSYRQVISAYPGGGGSYAAARENLGSKAGLIAAAGLSIDYILNVSVAISAGVGALVSAVPVLLPYTLEICLILLGCLSIANLRGVRDAGILFIIPTYFFIGCMIITLTVGIIRTILSQGHPIPLMSIPHESVGSSAIGVWLVLRSFASGCTAMTGVEAVSNGVPLFKKPNDRHAKFTLNIIILTLILLLMGIAFVVKKYHIMATHPGETGYQSILSQIFEAMFGRGIFYYISISAVIIVLILSANTSFAGFPRICRLLALDHYLPKVFSHCGRRLVYEEGIYVLFIVNTILLIAFKGITDRLIPLFAIGAFIAFTCSQAGMVVHWINKRNKQKIAFYSLTINFIGGCSTFTAFIVIFLSKFMEGAWLILFAIPVMVMMFQRERLYNEKIASKVHLLRPVNYKQIRQPIAVLPISVLDRIAEEGIRLGLEISDILYVVHVTAEEDDGKELKESWESLVAAPARAECKNIPELIILPSKYRDVFEPILNFIAVLRKEYPHQQIAVIIPQIIEPRWYHYIFRNTAMVLESTILWKEWSDVCVISLPMHLTGS